MMEGNDVTDDELDELMDKRRVRAMRVSRVLLSLLLLVGMFWAGVAVQKHEAPSSRVSEMPAPSARMGGSSGGGEGRQRPTTGEVKMVDGDTVYITAADGTATKVTTGANVTVQKTTPASVSDIKAGDTVSVQGSTNDDGSIDATSITDGVSTNRP